MLKLSALAIAGAASLLVGPGSAGADSPGATSSGTLTVTGEIAGSIVLTIEFAGGTTSGLGTTEANSSLGSISKYGAAPTGFTLSRGSSNWALSSVVGVEVTKANVTSTDYTLTAQLAITPASGVIWRLNGSTVSDSVPTTLTSTGIYGVAGAYSWDIIVSDSAAASAIDNVIVFTATVN